MIFDDDVDNYLEAALFTSTDEDDQPLDGQFGIDAFTDYARHQAKVELEEFDAEVQRVLSVLGEEKASELDLSYLGHDFWFSRNGHGVVFFDRPERYGDEIKDILQDLARSAGEVYVEFDDQVEDGEVGLSFSPTLRLPR